MQKCHVCLITYSHMWDVWWPNQNIFSWYLWWQAVCGVIPAHKKNKLEGISDFPQNYCVLPEEKHRNCQLIELLHESFKTLSQPSLYYPWFKKNHLSLNTLALLFSSLSRHAHRLSFVIFDWLPSFKKVLSNIMCVRGLMPDESRVIDIWECCAAVKSNLC